MLSPRFEHPRTVALMVGGLTLAVLVPWFGEMLGVIESTISFGHGGMTLHAPVLDNVVFASILMLAFTVAIIVTGTSAVFAARRRERVARKHLQLQAWQLRQLMPAP